MDSFGSGEFNYGSGAVSGGGDFNYGGGGGDSGGGGFMGNAETPAAMTSNSQNNSASPAPNKGGRDRQNLVPVTIAQILAADQSTPDDPFYINGKDVVNVKLVGHISSRQDQSTNITFQLRDCTGEIEIKYWVDADEIEHDSEMRESWTEGKYVRIVGTLKAFRDKRNVMAYNIRLVEDFNEVTHHFLEVVQFYCKVKTDDFGPKAGGMGMSMSNSGGLGSGGGNVARNTPGTALSAGTAPMNNSNDPKAKWSQQVMNIFRELGSNSDDGANVVAVGNRLPEIDSKQLRECITYLEDEGHLYSTIDEDHYKLTE